MVIHEWIEQHKVNVVDIVRSRRGCDELADDLAGVFNDCIRIILESSLLRRQLRGLEAELAALKPAQPAVEREEYGMHIRYTGD
jgi:hypothetical protein